MGELGDGAAVEPGRGDDVVAGPHQREERHDLRRVPGRGADRADAAFERREALGERHHRRVGQAGIDVAELLEVEEPGRVVGVAEDVGGVLVDRRLPRAGRRVGLGARVDLQRVETRETSRPFCPPLSASARGYARRQAADNRGRATSLRRASRGVAAPAGAPISGGDRGMWMALDDRRSRRYRRRARRALSALRRDLPAAHRRGDRAAAPLRRAERRYRDGEALFARRRAGAGDVHRAEGAGGDQPARRLRPAAAAGRAGAGTVPGRGGAALRAAVAGGRRMPRARRDHPDPAGRPAGAAGRRSRARRADHPGADPAPGAADPVRRGRAADHRRPGGRRRAAARDLPAAQRPSAQDRRPRERSRRRRGCSAIARRRAAGCRWW